MIAETILVHRPEILIEYPPEAFDVFDYLNRKTLWQALGITYSDYNDLTPGRVEDLLTLIKVDPKPYPTDNIVEALVGVTNR